MSSLANSADSVQPQDQMCKGHLDLFNSLHCLTPSLKSSSKIRKDLEEFFVQPNYPIEQLMCKLSQPYKDVDDDSAMKRLCEMFKQDINIFICDPNDNSVRCVVCSKFDQCLFFLIFTNPLLEGQHIQEKSH